MKRYLEPFIINELAKKMVFMGGPRQVDKTTLSHSFLKSSFKAGQYFNWDVAEDRCAILNKQWRQDSPLIVFDELHKFPQWKNWIKGVYDTKPPHQQYLVTGSARLDLYRHGGDSLMGRYHYWRLHPLTLDELPPKITAQEGYQRLLKFGGFPEPFLQNDEREARRWQRERFDRILREDIRDLEPVRQIQLIELFADALRQRVGSMLVLANLAEDLQVAPKTIKSWLNLIERMYIAFPIYPLTQNIPRAIQKPTKVYFYDNNDVIGDEGARLENLVANHLLKRLQFLEDYEGYRCSLHYIRDKEGREIDFATVIDGQLCELIEVKTRDKDIGASLNYYRDRLKPQRTIQLVGNLTRRFDHNGVEIMSPIDFFQDPPWRL